MWLFYDGKDKTQEIPMPYQEMVSCGIIGEILMEVYYG
jgi:hypothetical protein